MINKEIQSKLQKIGFSQHEAEVYLVLLKLGASSAGQIIKKTGLHRNVVYVALDKLINKKLVAEFMQKKVKNFKVLAPEKLLQQKKNQLDLTEELLPKLKDIKSKEKIEITVYEGKEGFQAAHKNAIDQLKKKETVYVMGGTFANFYENMGEQIEPFHQVRQEKHNAVKLIVFRSREKEPQVKVTEKLPYYQVKYLPSDYLNPVSTSIYGDLVFNIIYADGPTIVEMRSKELAKNYLNYFNFLWKLAKK